MKGLIYEDSALVSKERTYKEYKISTEIPFNFLYINLLAKDIDNMFYSGFSKRFKMSD